MKFGDVSAARCGVCRKQLDGWVGELKICPACETLHHEDCWEYIGSCARYGCAPPPPAPDGGVCIGLFGILSGLLQVAWSFVHGALALWMVGAILSMCSLGINHREQFRTASRSRVCQSNQTILDKTLGVWESQNTVLPVDEDLFIEVDTSGTIRRVSANLEDRFETTEGEELAPGSTILRRLVRDVGVFRCPTVVHEIGRDHFDTHTQIHYRFESHVEPREELRGKRRGVLCLPSKLVSDKDAGARAFDVDH